MCFEIFNISQSILKIIYTRLDEMFQSVFCDTFIRLAGVERGTEVEWSEG